MSTDEKIIKDKVGLLKLSESAPRLGTRRPMASATVLSHHPGRVLRHRVSQEALCQFGGTARIWTTGAEYNRTRPHSGKYCYGKTAMQTFLDSVSLAREKMLDRSVSSAPEPERSLAQRSAGGGAATGTAA